LRRVSLLVFIGIFLLSISKDIHASPWVGSIDPQLHHDLQLLSEWGYIDAAVTSFPVPWKGIVAQLDLLDEADLPPSALIALQRLKHYLQQLQRNERQSFVTMYAANDENRLGTFDGANFSQGRLSFDTELYSGRWAANVSINYLPGGQKNLDDSFVAYQFGNWNLRLGAIDQWWGPSNSSSLVLSSNARPIPALAFSRAESNRSEDSWLSFLGPWYFTTQIGQLESNRHIADAKISMTRFNFKPLSALELGASWLTIWGGEAQGNGITDFWDALTYRAQCLDDTVGCAANNKVHKGAHIAAFDFKYSLKLAKTPISFYGQFLAETRDAEPAKLLGLASYINGVRFYLETSDTTGSCSDKLPESNNCIYEDDVYRSGLRFHGRAIGSTFDSDAKVMSIGANKHFSDGDVIDLVLRRIELNQDKLMPSPIVVGKSEKVLQLTGFYQTNMNKLQIKVGGKIERSESDQQDGTFDTLFYTQLKYAF